MSKILDGLTHLHAHLHGDQSVNPAGSWAQGDVSKILNGLHVDQAVNTVLQQYRDALPNAAGGRAQVALPDQTSVLCVCVCVCIHSYIHTDIGTAQNPRGDIHDDKKLKNKNTH